MQGPRNDFDLGVAHTRHRFQRQSIFKISICKSGNLGVAWATPRFPDTPGSAAPVLK